MPKIEKIPRYYEVKERPEHICDAIVAGRLEKGMTPTDVSKVLGWPVRINKASYGDQAVHRQLCNVGSIVQENIFVYYRGNTVIEWEWGACRRT